MSQINTKWVVNGKTYEMDLQDADTAERYEKAFAKMGENEKKVQKDGTASARIRAYCALFRTLFDELFGEGAGVEIIGEKDNARVCNEIYDDFLAFVTAQKQEALESQKSILSRYSANRAQRRATAKNKP